MTSTVTLVPWPDDASRGRRASESGSPVLYLVGAESMAPLPTTCLEDWIRLPADERDLYARMSALQTRASVHQSPPRFDENHRLSFEGRVLALSSPEMELAALLTERFGQVVPDRDLMLAAALEGPTLLRAPVHRLRTRLRPLGLEVERCRRSGYRLRRR